MRGKQKHSSPSKGWHDGQEIVGGYHSAASSLGRSKSSGKYLIALCTGTGVSPPIAHSEPSSMVWQRSSSSIRFCSRSTPATILSITSTPRTEPIRQGVHLP